MVSNSDFEEDFLRFLPFKHFPPFFNVFGRWILCTLGWAEKLKMSKMYYGHKVPVVIHKNKDISLFTF